MKDMNGIKIIGVDQGYGNIKTADHCFPTGILGYDHEPLFTDDMLGVMVVIDHGAGLKSVYANLDETVDVDAGDPVEAGTVLGTVGTSAISESAGADHLHFAMKEYGVAVDPLNYLH